MYTLTITINKSFGSKNLRNYSRTFTPVGMIAEDITSWLLACLEDYKLTVLKDDTSSVIQLIDMIKDIRVLRNDGVVIISTSTDLYIDIFTLANCLIDAVYVDFKKIVGIHELVDNYFANKEKM